MNKNNYINLITICTCLIPTSLIVGAAVSEFFVSLTAIIFLVYTLNYKDWGYYRKKIFIILIAFSIYIVFGSLISEFPLNSLRSSAFYFRFSLLLMAIFFLLDNNKKFPQYFLWSIVIPLTVCFVYSMHEIVESIVFKNKIDSYRVSGFFGEELVQGSYFLRLLTLFVGVYTLVNNFFEKKKLIYYFIIFSSVLIILVSGERSSIGLMIIFTFLYLFYSNLELISKFKILISFFLIITLSILFLPGLKERVFDNTKRLLFEKGEVKIFSRGHQEHYISAVKMFKKNIITGVGVRNFRLECRKEEYRSIGVNSCTTHPHNTYIQFLAETGILGFLFIFSFLFYIVKFLILNFFKILKKKKIYYSAAIFSIAIFVNIFPLVPTGNFFNNWLSVMYYLPLAFFFYSLEKQK
jgi:O-antigen ligase